MQCIDKFNPTKGKHDRLKILNQHLIHSTSFTISKRYFCPVFRKAILSVLVILGYLNLHAQLLPNLGGQRAGLSALSFLKNDMSPRALAMGGASTALEGTAFSASNNPAGLATLENYNLALSHLNIGAGIQQSFVSSIHKLKNEASVAISLNSLYTGSMKVRTEFQPDGTGEYFSVNNSSLGVTYATRLSEMFSLGVSLKYIYESIAQYKNHTATTDIGFLYTTDFKDLRFAVLVQNFGGNSSLAGNTVKANYNRADPQLYNYTVPTVFKMGFSMVPYKNDKEQWLISAELNHPNDNAENIRLGVEYSRKKLLRLFAGYKISVKGQTLPTAGFSLKSRVGAHPLTIQYAVNPTNNMGTQHLLGLFISRNNDKR